MSRGGLSIKVIMLISGIALAEAASTECGAAAPPQSSGSVPAPTVIRGSAATPAQLPSENDATTIVIRGSPPPSGQPVASQSACPLGYFYDPGNGCIPQGYSYDGYDYQYWPYYGLGEFFSPRRHPAVSHRFMRGAHHGFARGLGHRSVRGVTHGRPAGFGRGSVQAGGFGHR
jgi:hypothetical protein